jgi:UPF0271 protein
MGEIPGLLANGTEEALMKFVSSANIACGGHAGDASSMEAMVRLAIRHRVAVGAHPSYPDKENFGRSEMNMTAAEVSSFVYEQVRSLADVARKCGGTIAHVKPHGALYNRAANDREVAQAIAAGVSRFDRSLILVGQAGSQMLDCWKREGFNVAAEGFADRRYERNGSLRPRKLSNALILDPAAAGRQAVDIAVRGRASAYDGTEIVVEAQSLCIHGDTPGAAAIVAEVKNQLEKAGVEITSLRSLLH